LRADEAKKPPSSSSEKIEFARQITPLLTKYCTGCHGGAKPRGKLALDTFKDEADALKKQELWERVADSVRTKEMPPQNKPQPKQVDRELIVSWVGSRFAAVDCVTQRDPGRVTMRRLNRFEYNNTVRDLVGVDFKPAQDFPADDIGYGFDNIGDVLTLPPLLMEKYLAASEKIIDAAYKDPAVKKRLLIAPATDKEAPRKILGAFLPRAFRRPVPPEEVDRYVRLVESARKDGDDFETAVGMGLQAILTSPYFLFRVELDAEPKNPKVIRTINEFELATRLSYFLWSSMPDEELLGQAGQGTLRKNLEAQVRRMLKDPKARTLVDNFAGQWLLTRNLKSAAPDPGLFPAFDDKLRAAMQKETELFFESIVKEDRGILDFLDADYTFVNERLAKHYGIAGVRGEEFRRVSLAGTARGGILTQASILTVTSNPTRTSPVKRGKYILENILGTPPPPPPPDAGELNDSKEVVDSAPLRKRMEQHRANPNCAVCHQRMDPLGFAFENFDAIGAWRDKDGRFPIEPAGSLPDGTSFQGPEQVRAALKGKAKEFRKCLTEKLLTYGLGRGLEPSDKCSVDQLADNVARQNDRFSSLVMAIVQCEPFQMRRGKGR
jgi:mono/diheme cytochrome c family protein